MKKTLLFDLFGAQPSKDAKFHGGGEYIKTIFKTIILNFNDTIKIIVFYNNKKYIDDWITKLLYEKKIKIYNVETLNEICEIFKIELIDIFYSGLPNNYNKIIFPENLLKIATIHGLRGIEKPVDQYQYIYNNGIESIKSIVKYKLLFCFRNKSINKYFDILYKFNEIVCVSNHTKYSILNFFPDYNSDRIHVFYTPEKVLNKNTCDDNIQKITEKYIFMLSVNRWEKNVYRALLAIEKLYSQNKLNDYKVVLVGGISKKIFKKIKNPNRYILFDYIEPYELESLYANCDIFLYPTLNEGFGMPPLEAMKYGKTCIVSSVCSLPEICGDAVYYVNPYDVDEIKNRLLQSKDNKINKDVIKRQLDKIVDKQRKDLMQLCEYIIK